eukprot:TRINITY_DN2134_c0_g2_i1.p1 TRINITY_DN2134_c0_g2~~TRINITY_DN2134_c0_g2_i1.p1  ORF type:complete len:138 (-),score=23.08 TRINITY_DN2134_c0_g2_i1:26-439(-)
MEAVRFFAAKQLGMKTFNPKYYWLDVPEPTKVHTVRRLHVVNQWNLKLGNRRKMKTIEGSVATPAVPKEKRERKEKRKGDKEEKEQPFFVEQSDKTAEAERLSDMHKAEADRAKARAADEEKKAGTTSWWSRFFGKK